MIFWKEIKKRIIEDNLMDMAAQMAYYFLLSFFPFLLLTVTLFAYLPVKSQDILILIRPFAPNDTYHMIESNLKMVLDHPQGGLLSFSLLAMIYITSIGFRSLIRMMDSAYQVEEDRAMWKEFLLGFFVMFGLMLALLISLVLPIFGSWIELHVFQLFGLNDLFLKTWFWIRWLLSSFLLLSFFWVVYIWGPNTHVSWREALPGSLFATLGWQLSSLGFSFYVSTNPYTTIYGNLGAIMVLVGWFYLSALVLILGGQLNATLRTLKSL